MTEAEERLEEAYRHIAARREEIRSEHRDPALEWDRIWECLADQALHRKILRAHENGSESLEAVIDGIIDGYWWAHARGWIMSAAARA